MLATDAVQTLYNVCSTSTRLFCDVCLNKIKHLHPPKDCKGAHWHVTSTLSVITLSRSGAPLRPTNGTRETLSNRGGFVNVRDDQ